MHTFICTSVLYTVYRVSLEGDRRGVRVLHRGLDRLLLPEDAPRHARAAHPQRHRPDRQQHLRLDARQVPGQSVGGQEQKQKMIPGDLTIGSDPDFRLL